MIELFVKGLPKGQPRARAFSRGGKAGTYNPGTADEWKNRIADAWQASRNPPMQDLPLLTFMEFYMPRPKSHLKKDGSIKPTAPHFFTGKPDADNLAKAVLDILTQVNAWRDDSLVVDCRVIKRYANGATGVKLRIDYVTK